MADKYIALNGFRYGLDGRREALTSLPGTLVQLTNAHINPGAEIEQRMSFARQTNGFPSNTFGLQDTDSGLVTFGSDASPNAALPTGVSYQQLKHPTGFSSGPTAITMLAVKCSTNFLGKAFVVAVFSDNRQFAYYNGNLVAPTRNGLVLVNSGGIEAVTDLANDLAAQINGVIDGWVAYPNQTVFAGVGVARNGSCIVTSPIGVHFTPVPSAVTTNSGIISAKLIDQNLAGKQGVSAVAAFTLNAGTFGNVTVSAPANATDAAHTAQLTGGAIPFNTSLAQTAADVVTAINLFSGATGYVAHQNSLGSTSITVYGPVAFGNFGGFTSNNLHVHTDGDITTTSSAAVNQYSFVIVPNPAKNIVTTAFSIQPMTVAQGVQISTRGANGSASYVWEECNIDGTTPVKVPSQIAFAPDQQSGASCLFSISSFKLNGQTFNLADHTPGTFAVTGYFKVTGTDNGGASGSPSSQTLTVILGTFIP